MEPIRKHTIRTTEGWLISVNEHKPEFGGLILDSAKPEMVGDSERERRTLTRMDFFDILVFSVVLSFFAGTVVGAPVS